MTLELDPKDEARKIIALEQKLSYGGSDTYKTSLLLAEEVRQLQKKVYDDPDYIQKLQSSINSSKQDPLVLLISRAGTTIELDENNGLCGIVFGGLPGDKVFETVYRNDQVVGSELGWSMDNFESIGIWSFDDSATPTASYKSVNNDYFSPLFG